MCNSAPVALACWRDAQNFERGLSFLGICGDWAHSMRKSSHNSASAPGGQEDPVGGVGYDPRYCHALDIGHGGDRAKAKRMRDELLKDRRVRYVIDDGRGYYAAHMGGGTFWVGDHETHIHVSFMPGSTFQTSPAFFTGKPAAPPVNWPLNEKDHGFVVLILEINLVHCGFPGVKVDSSFGPQTLAAAREMQMFLHRGRKPYVTRGDFIAINGWAKMIGENGGHEILTLSDRGPRVSNLRRHLRKLGKHVGIHGAYDTKVQTAMLEIQRYFDLGQKAGNATPAHRRFVRELAQL